MVRTIIYTLLLFCATLSFGIVFHTLSRTLARDDIFNPTRNTHNSVIYSSEMERTVAIETSKVEDASDEKESSKTQAVERTNGAKVVESTSTSSRPSCFDNNGTPCRYDDVGKYLEESAKFTIIHRPSDAIPAVRKIPKNQGNNATYIAERRSKGPKDGSLTALVEYNPTLLPLTSDFDPVLLNYLTGRYHKDISDEEADKVKYLSIARGANFHNCGVGMRRMNNPTEENSYLSLALLDGDLQPIPGASASLRLAQAVLPWKCYNKFLLEPFQDYQVIAVRSTKGNDKKDQLFVMASDVGTHIFAFDIRRVPAPTNNASGWDTKVKGRPIPMIAKHENDSHQFYGQGLQVRLMEDNNAPGNKMFCNAVLNSNVMDFQKNYHIFEARRDGILTTYMEIRPHGRRSMRKVNFYADRFHKIGDWELVPNGTISEKGHRDKGNVIVNKASDGPEDQWKYPFPEKTGWKDSGSRGTSCCIDLAWGSNETVKVGISHGVSEERGYVSRFYAFETKSSRFRNVAVSGPFCLGGMAEYDINAETQIFPYPDRNNLVVGNETYTCPHITFASGLVDYQADANYAILSYGVNDCYSRSIVISKDRIREFLNLSGGGSLIAVQ